MGFPGKLKTHLPTALYRRRFPIYVVAPPYNPRSGGIRVMHLLIQSLTRLGYDAYGLTPPPAGATSRIRYVGRYIYIRAKHALQRRKVIAVYPEGIAGNPINAPFVLRYLLNKPGYLVPGVELSFGPDDLYLTFDSDHVPSGRHAFDLFWPLVDRTIYYPPSPGTVRQGFAIFTNRMRPDLAQLPAWLAPYVVLSMEKPRSHGELADIYRRSIAMVTYERSAAIYEALCCGCPVICIPDGPFTESTYQRRFNGAGQVWGWQNERLAQAAADIERFESQYRDLERTLDKRICAAFDTAIALFRLRMIGAADHCRSGSALRPHALSGIDDLKRDPSGSPFDARRS